MQSLMKVGRFEIEIEVEEKFPPIIKTHSMKF